MPPVGDQHRGPGLPSGRLQGGSAVVVRDLLELPGRLRRGGAPPSGQQGLDQGGEQPGPVEASPGFPERALEPSPSSGGVTFGQS